MCSLLPQHSEFHVSRYSGNLSLFSLELIIVLIYFEILYVHFKWPWYLNDNLLCIEHRKFTQLGTSSHVQQIASGAQHPETLPHHSVSRLPIPFHKFPPQLELNTSLCSCSRPYASCDYICTVFFHVHHIRYTCIQTHPIQRSMLAPFLSSLCMSISRRHGPCFTVIKHSCIVIKLSTSCVLE